MKLMVLNPERGPREESERYQFAYYSPDVHPREESIICVRCRNVPVGEGRSGVEINCDLVRVFPGSKEQVIIFSPRRGALINSPVYSPDGNYIALFVGRDVVILDANTGETRRTVLDVKVDAAHPENALIRTDYLRWGNDEELVFVLARVQEHKHQGGIDKPGECPSGFPNDVGEINARTGEMRWLGIHDIYFLHGKYAPSSCQSRVAHQKGGNAALPSIPAVRALLGSVENPVKGPMWSRDRRFYFYRRVKEGFLAKEWIEGYDVEVQRSFIVKTLWRAFYVE